MSALPRPISLPMLSIERNTPPGIVRLSDGTEINAFTGAIVKLPPPAAPKPKIVPSVPSSTTGPKAADAGDFVLGGASGFAIALAVWFFFLRK